MSTSSSSDTKKGSTRTEAESWIVSLLIPFLGDQEPIPEEIRAILSLAKEAGLDWEKLYKDAVWVVTRTWNRPYPSVSDVAPPNDVIPRKPGANVQLDESDPDYHRQSFVNWLTSMHKNKRR
jgi:hypothetical protein